MNDQAPNPYNISQGCADSDWFFNFEGVAHGGFASEVDARIALERLRLEASLPQRLRLASALVRASRRDARILSSKFAAGLGWEHLDEAMNALAARYTPRSPMRDLLESIGTYMVHQHGDRETAEIALDDASKALSLLIAEDAARAAEARCRP